MQNRAISNLAQYEKFPMKPMPARTPAAIVPSPIPMVKTNNMRDGFIVAEIAIVLMARSRCTPKRALAVGQNA